jgi:hypothetical protein
VTQVNQSEHPSPPLRAVIHSYDEGAMGGIHLDTPPFQNNRRLLKAAILYADTLEAPALSFAVLRERELVDQYGPQEGGRRLLEGMASPEAMAGASVVCRLNGHPSPVELPPSKAAAADAALSDLQAAMASGILLVPHHETSETAVAAGVLDWLDSEACGALRRMSSTRLLGRSRSGCPKPCR